MPLVNTILRNAPIKKAQQLTTASKFAMKHGALAVQNMRSSGGNATILFSQMLAATDNEEKTATLTDCDIKEEAGNLIVARSDTAAVTLTYVMWAVPRLPELQSQLKHEITQLSDDLSTAELETTPIMNSVIEETLRLYGAAPGGLPQTVPGQGADMGRYHIPGGVEVSTQAYTNHRDPLVFTDPP